MNVKIKRTIDYVPTWEKNRDNTTNPIVFKLKYLSTFESDECYSITPLQLDIKGKKVGGGQVTVDRKKMFTFAVMEIENLTVTDESSKQTPIKTAEEMLMTPGMEELFFEVIAYIRGMDARQDPKNS